MAYLKFPLFLGRYVNRWLVSGIAQTPVHFTPVTLHGDINLWLKKGFSVHENPCKTEFVRARRACPAALPAVWTAPRRSSLRPAAEQPCG